jgi:hypothetical protein
MYRTALAVAIAGVFAQPCLAADTEPASRSEVEALRQEVNELKAQIKELLQERRSEAAAAKAAPPATSAARSDTSKPAAQAEPRSAETGTASASAEKPASPVSLFGYGEINYNNYTNDSSRSQADLRRFVVGFGYAFSDQLHFNSEAEWEHAVTSADDQGEVEIEQAYLDYQANQHFSVKGGLFLMPFGWLNQRHEPPVYYGVERNEVETRIIPTTWREGGVGVTWATDNGISYELGVTTGFDISKFDDPSAPLRSMHQELQLARAHDLSYYAAVNYRGIPGFTVGGAAFYGNSTQGNAAFRADNTQPDFDGLNGRVTLWDVHARWQPGNFDLQALYARGHIGDAAQIDDTLLAFNQANGADRQFVPAGFYGWYGQAAYRLRLRENVMLAPFVRYEYYNTQSSMPAGFAVDPTNANHVLTGGVNFYPHPQVVIKADYQKYTDRDNNRFDLGLGYMF